MNVSFMYHENYKDRLDSLIQVHFTATETSGFCHVISNGHPVISNGHPLLVYDGDRYCFVYDGGLKVITEFFGSIKQATYALAEYESDDIRLAWHESLPDYYRRISPEFYTPDIKEVVRKIWHGEPLDGNQSFLLEERIPLFIKNHLSFLLQLREHTNDQYLQLINNVGVAIRGMEEHLEESE